MTYVVSVVKRAGMIGWVVEDVRPALHGVCHYRRRLEPEIREAISRRLRLDAVDFQIEIRERTDP